MTIRESDGRIVPLKSGPQPDGMKPSNIGAGKAVFASRGSRPGCYMIQTEHRPYSETEQRC